jgi:hypothetical protein
MELFVDFTFYECDPIVAGSERAILTLRVYQHQSDTRCVLALNVRGRISNVRAYIRFVADWGAQT